MKQPILVIGGAGTIGAHTCVDLLAAGCEVVVLDNLSSRRSVLGHIERIARIPEGGVSFVEADVREPARVEDGAAALLQPGRRARVRDARRGSRCGSRWHPE